MWHQVTTHKVLVGVGLGLIAVTSGGLALPAEGALAAILDAVAVGAGGAASALDYGPCHAGDQAACGAFYLGAGGAAAGLVGLTGDLLELFNVVADSGAWPFKLAAGVAYEVGGFGFAFDLGPGINDLIQFLEKSGLTAGQTIWGTCPNQTE